MLFVSQVLQTLLTCCQGVIQRAPEDVDARLQGLERVAKATVLGHMVPCLITALTHPNLQALGLADTLMPILVELVVLSSQVIHQPAVTKHQSRLSLSLNISHDCPCHQTSVTSVPVIKHQSRLSLSLNISHVCPCHQTSVMTVPVTKHQS